MPYDGMLAESVRVSGHNEDLIDGYLARPLGSGPFPGVVLLHHMPGWDESSKEMVRKFAYHGYICISPNLHYRTGPGSLDDVVARVRTEGGNPDEQVIGDVAGSIAYLNTLPYYSGKVGAIGFCSGGRQTVIVASKLDIDAAVDCWGGRVVMAAEDLTDRMPVAPIDMTAELRCPLMGIFGLEDQSPSPLEVDQHEAALMAHSKTHEFLRYADAGHSFLAPDETSYRVEQAIDAWSKIFEWYGKYLGN